MGLVNAGAQNWSIAEGAEEGVVRRPRTTMALAAITRTATSAHRHRDFCKPGFGDAGVGELGRLPLENRPVGTRWDVDPNEAVRPVLVVLRQPLPHLGCPHSNHGVIARLVIMAAAEYFGPDDPFAKKIVFAGERVLDYILQKALALARGPKWCALKDFAQRFPDPDGIGARYDLGARLRNHRWTCSPPKVY